MRRVILTATAVFLAATLLVGPTADAAPTSVFVTIGNPGNDPASADNTSHGQSHAYGYGAVDYVYEISQTAVSIAEWDQFYGDGTNKSTGIGGGTAVGSFNPNYNYWNSGTRTVGADAPAVHISFNQAAQYVNWLTTGDATDGVYTIDGSGHVTGVAMSRMEALAEYGIAYFLPTEDEWYKAAYYDPNKDGLGVGGYWLYPTQQDGTIAEPGLTFSHRPVTTYAGIDDYTAVYRDGEAANPATPAPVDQLGGLSAYGAMGPGGNVWEWNETLIGSSRGMRGGAFHSVEMSLRASSPNSIKPTYELDHIGFRVARVTPEPGGVGALVGMAAVGFLWLWRRQ